MNSEKVLNINVHLKNSEYFKDILILVQNTKASCRKVNTHKSDPKSIFRF